MNINTVTVIGANGTLGKEISGIFASFGNAKVYMVARTKEKAELARKEAAFSVKALSVEENLIPKTYEDLKSCIKESDIIFESIVEDYDEKKKLHEKINDFVSENSIIATGTSGLSIDKLAESYSIEKRKRFVGIHFFNPPYSLTLCEIIPSKYNNDDLEFISDLRLYLNNCLRRDSIIVKDKPAFLANRIGFKMMNEALQLAYEYRKYGGIDYIDAILGAYTGRSMAPIETVDFVGLDIHRAIVNNIYDKATEKEKKSFKLPEYMNELIENKQVGAKVRCGLYKTNVGDNNKLVYDIETKQYRNIKEYNFEFKNKAIECFKKAKYYNGIQEIINDTSNESNICMKFLLKYIVYALETANLVAENVTDCDIAMATGFNWIPPFALIKALGGNKNVVDMCQKYLEKQFKYDEIMNKEIDSIYDYRKFLKARE